MRYSGWPNLHRPNASVATAIAQTNTMSLSVARKGASSLARSRASTVAFSQRRLASSDHHDHHHDDHHHDGGAIAYPQEGFNSKGWIYSILFGASVVAFYNFAPAPGDESSITRWIKSNYIPADYWQQLNDKHLSLSKEASDNYLLVSDARKPAIHRFRYPQAMAHGSPHLAPVGQDVDFSSLKVKGE